MMIRKIESDHININNKKRNPVCPIFGNKRIPSRFYAVMFSPFIKRTTFLSQSKI